MPVAKPVPAPAFWLAGRAFPVLALEQKMIMVTLAFVAVLAAILGFSAHRASIAPRAGAELCTRGAAMLASIIKSVLWIARSRSFCGVKTSPLPGGAALSVMTTIGGFVFGLALR